MIELIAVRVPSAVPASALHVQSAQIEVIPHARFEVVPNLVLEVAVGIGLTRDLGEIYRLRLLLGFTYEFDILGRKRG